MGKSKRTVPKNLPQKLKLIRTRENLTMEMILQRLNQDLKSLGYDKITMHSGYISDFEVGKREPTLPVLFSYSRIGAVSLEYLIDDRIED